MASVPKTEPKIAMRALTRAYTLDWETLAYVVIFIAAVLTRFIDLGVTAMSHDESLHTKYSWYLYHDGNYGHTPMMHGPLLFHMTALSYFLFGDNDFTSRIYVAVIGVALVMIPLLFRRWIGRAAALVASVLLLISPYILYYSRYIRHDIPAILYALLMVWAAFSYIEDRERKPKWLYIIALSMILLLASKEVSFFYIAIVGLFFTLFFGAQLLQQWFKAVDSRLLFDVVMAGIILGGIIAIGLFVVLTIIPRNTWDQAIPSADDPDVTYGQRAALWQVLAIAPLVLLFLGVAAVAVIIRLLQGRGDVLNFRLVMATLAVLAFAAVAAGALVKVEEVTHIEPLNLGETATPLDPEAAGGDGVADGANMLVKYGPLIFVDLLVITLVGGFAVFSRAQGWWTPFLRLPAFDVLIIMGTLVLPWLTAFAIYFEGENPTRYDDVWVMALNLIPFLVVSVIVGLAWDWRWAVAAGIFYAVFVFLFTTMFTNGQGILSGMVGSLGYWLEQQGERRGSQPQYYYVLQVIFYEFLPLVGALGAGVLALGDGFRRLTAPPEQKEEQSNPGRETEAAPATAAPEPEAAPPLSLSLMRPPAVTFFGYLAVLNFAAYTFAGEKMPWLTTHLTVPMIFLAAWFVGRVVEGIDWGAFRARGWWLLWLAPLLFFAGLRVLWPMMDANMRPFQGMLISQLYRTGEWLAAFAVLAGGMAVVVYVLDRTGVMHLVRLALVVAFIALGAVTVRSAWTASFINYNSPKEYMFYAHAAPATKFILNMVEEISMRTTGSKELVFAYDNINSWPMSWYFRDFPNARFYGENPSPPLLDGAKVILAGDANIAKVAPIVQDRYYRFDLGRMVWPMQDYFGMTMEKVDKLFAPNADGALLRQGLFDIWWYRDYDTYARATGRDASAFAVNQWPIMQRTAVFVRKDIAAQAWPYGVGETALMDFGLKDPYELNALTLDAVQVLGGESGLNGPRGLALDKDGNLYVVDAGNNRVVVFGLDGKEKLVIGGTDPNAAPDTLPAPGYFREPWGVGVADDGTIFVADTWGHRIQVFTPAGEFVTLWGRFADINNNPGSDSDDAFYGPRQVVVRGDEVYVVDTGNKRVRVYDFAGNHLRDLGGGGVLPGQLSEPVGLALDKDGNVVIADTWNRRVQVLDPGGVYLRHWTVEAWYELVRNLPFLAYDDRGSVYVADPELCRVLVFDANGQYRYRFGQCAEQPSPASFRVLGGLVMGDGYQLYVADAGANRILRFDLAVEPVLQAPPVEVEKQEEQEKQEKQE
ncbi:MAG: TIGR03663 family protein [Anaerolineae bacterium]|nr:TIGR03663 family protein [Anaerolineae bacterium]